jgi:hypothetical protein
MAMHPNLVSVKCRQIGRTDLAGGGQVVVENGYAFVGHMDPPHGTTILDVKDPKHPKIVAEIEILQGVHSHKVRVSGDVMLVNLERYRSKEKQPTGLKVYDISNRGPKRLPNQRGRTIVFFDAATLHLGVYRGYVLSDDLDGMTARPVEVGGGGCRANGSAAADATWAPRISATIRSGGAIGSTPATGTAAS